MEGDVFTAIISMCSARILSRLRFAPNARGNTKPSFDNVLQQAVDSLEQLMDDEFKKLFSIATVFEKTAKEVIKLADSWRNDPTLDQLRELVNGIYGLRQVGEINLLLETIPSRLMDPSSVESLSNIISKVSRYREAARFLYHTAKKFRLVRNMKVVLVNLPEEAFDKSSTFKYNPTLASTISRISSEHHQWNLTKVCSLLNTTERKANNNFSQRTFDTLENAKIHAEIQLLFYCERSLSRLPSRVVCSSKDACYLCNLFILTHGKMHTPRCHGRLYPRWCLPRLPAFSEIEQRFNQVLENDIAKSLEMLFLKRKQTLYPIPNESTLLTLLVSSSTLHSLTVPNGITTVNPEAKIKAVTEATDENMDIRPQNQRLPSDSTFDHSSELIQGQILSKSIGLHDISRCYTAGSLRVQIEYSSGSTSDNSPRELEYGLEWLTLEDVQRLEHRAISIIDAESIENETTYTLDDLNYLYIAARGSVVKIVVHQKG